jgi:hypothetical protein
VRGAQVDAQFYNSHLALIMRPPAVFGDSAACNSVTCPLLEQYAHRNDVDPRLRELAVITLFLRDPARHFDLLTERATNAGPMLQTVYRALGTPVPPPGADHDVWWRWHTARFTAEPMIKTATALRIAELRTGRDLRSEFRNRLVNAATEQERRVFATFALELDAGALTIDDAKQFAESGAPLLATRIVRPLLRRATPTDSVAASALEAVMRYHFACAELPWTIEPRRACTQPPGPENVIVSDSMPGSIVERWRGQLPFRSAAEERLRDRHKAGTARTYTVSRVGDFVEIKWRDSGTIDRRADSPPYNFTSGGSMFVMRTATGWILIESDHWMS